MPEIVSGIGTIINPEDIDQIANTMKEISLENTLRNESQDKGLSRAKEFSWKLAAEEIVNLIA